jgi:hypothetical protein
LNHFIKIATMTKENNAFWTNSMNYGAVAGFLIIIFSLLLYFAGLQDNTYLGLMVFPILILVMIWGTLTLRNKIQNGQMTYGRGLGAGTTISLFASVIVAVYMFVFFKFIDPEAIDRITSMQETKMLEQGMSEEQVNMAIEMTKKFTNPITMAVGSVFSYTLYGFLFSLVISAFLKKKPNSFDAAMSEIENEIKND